MVLWEAFLDIEGAEELTGENHRFNDLRDKLGTINTRHSLMPLVYPLHIGWHVYELAIRPSPESSELVPFDWSFAPWFLNNCVSVQPEQTATITLHDDWLDQCRAAARQRHHSPETTT